jgi:hypothetical protein
MGGYPVDSKYLDRKKERIIISRVRKTLKDNFSVYLNGRPVRREVSLPRYNPQNIQDPNESSLLHQRGLGFDILAVKSPKGTPVHFDGYLVVQSMQLFPQELRGVLIRLRGVAIGWHWTLNLSAAGLSTMLPCLSGEIWVDGIEDALQFDRESFREDHPKFITLRNQIEAIVRQEAPRFRQRSSARTAMLRNLRPRGTTKRTKKQKKVTIPPPIKNPVVAPAPPLGTTAPQAAVAIDNYLPAEIFDQEPEYIRRLIPQINGSWEREYYEACAMVIRRLIETLIIELYHRRRWLKEVQNPTTKDFFTLKALINKICGDQRIGLEGRVQSELKNLKKLGDIATHDFRIKVRKFDLEKVRNDLRFACERLLFKITGTGP